MHRLHLAGGCDFTRCFLTCASKSRPFTRPVCLVLSYFQSRNVDIRPSGFISKSFLQQHDQTNRSRRSLERIQTLLVDLLNEVNSEVREGHESTAGKEMKVCGIYGSILDVEIEDGHRLVDTVEDEFDLGSSKEGPGNPDVAADALYAAQLQHVEEFRPRREIRAPPRLLEESEYQDVYTQHDKGKRGQSTDDLEFDESGDEYSTYHRIS